MIWAKFCFPSEPVSVSVRWGHTQLTGGLHTEEGLSLEARPLALFVPAGRMLVVQVWGRGRMSTPLGSLLRA